MIFFQIFKQHNMQSTMFQCRDPSCGAFTPKKIGHCTHCHEDGHWKDHRDRRTGDRVTLCPKLKEEKNQRRKAIKEYNFSHHNEEEKCVVIQHEKTAMQMQIEKLQNIAVTKMARMAMKLMFGLIVNNWQEDLQSNIKISIQNSIEDCGMFISTKNQKKGKKGKKGKKK